VAARRVEAARLTELEENRPGTVEQGEAAQRTVGGGEVEVRHAAMLGHTHLYIRCGAGSS
jgi:hypothetical protein